MVNSVHEIILERIVNHVVMQCGYNRIKGSKNFTPFVKVNGIVTQFDDISEARSAFWGHVKG